MANPKITLSVDQSIIDTLVNLTAALNRVADSMSGVASATDAVSKSAKIAKEAMMAESVAAVPNPNAFVVGEQIKEAPVVSPELMEKAAAAVAQSEPVPTEPRPLYVPPIEVPVTANYPDGSSETIQVPIATPVQEPSKADLPPMPIPPAQPYVQPYPPFPQQAATVPIIQQPAAPMPTAPGVEITKEQLMMAGVSLMDRGINANTVLWEFGVQSVDQLQKEQYGAFAERLRQLGAKI